MAVFGRKRRASGDVDSHVQEQDDARRVDESEDADLPQDAATPDSAPGTQGPYDRDEVPGLEGRLDLGSLWLAPTPGMQVRLDMDPQTGEVTSVTAMLGQSSLQLQAFAAPKSEGIWAEIRAEIAQSVTAQGGTAQEAAGTYGTELHTRIPARGADGRTVHQQARFIGVDGPRWFLRGVVTGPAAADVVHLAPMLFVLASTVVVRGTQARAPRELLPLSLPTDLATEDAVDDDPEASGDPELSELKPFERGPEITEIR